MQIPITDPKDTRLAPYRNILERDLVKNKRQFIAEGKTVLQVLVQQDRFKLSSLLILRNRLEGIESMIGRLREDLPVYVVEQSVIDSVAGFPMHRGVLGIGEQSGETNATPASETAKDWKTVVVLSGISNHDNVGSIFRNAAAFGVDAILIDGQTCDPLYRKSIRVSVGGVFKVPYFRFPTAADIVDWLEAQNFYVFALSPSGATSLSKWAPPPKSAILLGAEGEGLAPSLMQSLETIRVEMPSDFDSLNVATTSGIVLHHMAVVER